MHNGTPALTHYALHLTTIPMKLFTLLVASQLFALMAFADSPTGFADIPFGTSLAEAQKAISSRDGLKPGSATSEKLTYSGGSFAGQPISLWTLVFAGGKLAQGSVLVDKVKKNVYDDLKAQLTKKYGKPDAEKGHHSWECLWEFRSDGRRTVRLQYEFEGRVVLTYAHDGLVKTATRKSSDL